MISRKGRAWEHSRDLNTRPKTLLGSLRPEEVPGPMAGAGPTMLLREENGCCSRRQSSSSAGVSVGLGSGGAVGERPWAGRGGAGWRGWKRKLQFPAALAAPPAARGLLGVVVRRACSRDCARLKSCPALAGL